MTVAAQSPITSFNPNQPFSSMPSSLFSPPRKRTADSPEFPADALPPLPGGQDQLGSSTGSNHQMTSDSSLDHRVKRRRPNLAYGFQGLTISRDQIPSLPLPAVDLDDVLDESEGIEMSKSNTNDIKVEILPDRGSKPSHHHSSLHHWSIPNRGGPSSSSSSASPSPSSEDNYDSDAMFTNAVHRSLRYAGHAQQASEVVQPEIPALYDSAFSVEDVTGRRAPGQRRGRDDDSGSLPSVKRLRRDGIMDTDERIEETDGNYHDKRRKRKTVWHEPEKDRIVITALSDASSSRNSSRSVSPEREERNLAQPGDYGFTLSPSLLTHLLKAQRDQLDGIPVSPGQGSLVLYRPLGIRPGDWTEPVVKAWQSDDYVDTGRFEEIGDDETFEHTMLPDQDMNIDVDGDVEMDQ